VVPVAKVAGPAKAASGVVPVAKPATAPAAVPVARPAGSGVTAAPVARPAAAPANATAPPVTYKPVPVTRPAVKITLVKPGQKSPFAK
jgi:hypothetical protein